MKSFEETESALRKLLAKGHAVAALRIAQREADLFPQQAWPHRMLGLVFENLERWNDARQSYERALALGGPAEVRERLIMLARKRPEDPPTSVPIRTRFWISGINPATMSGLQTGMQSLSYKGMAWEKSPFDLALQIQVLEKNRPRTLLDIGPASVGGAYWLADVCENLGLTTEVHVLRDSRPAGKGHRRMTFHEGSTDNLATTFSEKIRKRLPRPWVVMLNTDHRTEATESALRFFDECLTPADMLIVETGPVNAASMETGSAPHDTLRRFLRKNFIEWEIATEYCDRFGANATWCPNGYLRKTGLKKVGTDTAPELGAVVERLKKREWVAALDDLETVKRGGKSKRGVDYLRAYALFRLDRLSEALRAAIEELSRNPEHPQALRLHAFLAGELPDATPAQLWRLPSPAAGEPLYLANLGCGNRHHPAWINLDIAPSAPGVIDHNIGDYLPFGDGVCAAVYHSHVLEHLPKTKAPGFIAECFRVLAPGGILRIAVPDLEGIARSYLDTLDRSAAGDKQAPLDHEWAVHEMVDQLVRHQPGGAILEYWKQNPMPAEAFVLQRVGGEAGEFIKSWRSQPAKAAGGAVNVTPESVGRFRLGGEAHQWMYDRLSLDRLLEDAGFVGITTVTATNSGIPGFNDYRLDVNELGEVRKPDSLFMEARKP